MLLTPFTPSTFVNYALASVMHIYYKHENFTINNSLMFIDYKYKNNATSQLSFTVYVCVCYYQKVVFTIKRIPEAPGHDNSVKELCPKALQ